MYSHFFQAHGTRQIRIFTELVVSQASIYINNAHCYIVTGSITLLQHMCVHVHSYTLVISLTSLLILGYQQTHWVQTVF